MMANDGKPSGTKTFTRVSPHDVMAATASTMIIDTVGPTL